MEVAQAQYFRPHDLGSALKWLADNDARVAAGCTDLLASTESQRLTGNVLDVTAIQDLRGISKDDEYWRFGATTTWTDVIKSELPAAFDSLKLAAREVGSPQIQNAGTLAGNLCNASPAADGVPCWLTLDARVELVSTDSKRILPLQEFITGPRRTECAQNELVSAILVPHHASRGRSSFLKLGARKYLVISIAMVAVRLVEDAGTITDCAVSVGSCSAVATRLTKVEGAITGQRLSQLSLPNLQELVEATINPIDDLRSDARGRLAAACELTQRCISSLATDKVDVK